MPGKVRYFFLLFKNGMVYACKAQAFVTEMTYVELYDLGWYTACTEGKDKVYGELIEFDDPEILRRIDILEGYIGEESPFNFYNRKEIMVFTGKGKFTTWAYFLKKSKIIDSDGEVISSGRWKKIDTYRI